jgi:ubiquinone/menaquinone biosynthesis C-methylase UbiE
MSSKSYYEKYWNPLKKQEGHASNVPNWPLRELEIFYNSISKYIGNNILDIGSGEGIFLKYLLTKRKIKKLTGLEISRRAIKIAKRQNKEVEFIQGSADNKYIFKTNSFDTIFMTDVIEHLVDIDFALKEIKRVLKPNGNLIIITPDFNILKKIIIALLFWERFFYPTNPHIRFFTKKSMDGVMKKYSFKRIYYRWGITWFNIMPQNSYFVYQNIK